MVSVRPLGVWLTVLSVLAVMLLSLACVRSASAQAREPGIAPPNPTEKWRAELSAADGFLFLNGQYVPLPCDVALEGESLTIGGVLVESTPPLPGGDWPGGKTRRHRPGSGARRLGTEIVQHLIGGDVVVLFPNQPLIAVPRGKPQYDLLTTLLSDSGRVTPVSVNRQLRAEHQPAWGAWLATFEPAGEFRRRAEDMIALYDQREAEGISAIAANRRLHLFAYPLSVLGMVVTTLGMGHLLSHRPPVGAKSLETDASPLALRVLTYSLALVVVYAVLDLTWTILAHQAGQMLELNPLGSHLIENPLHLVAFKAGATGLAVGLLFVLRKYRRAQLAAWWVCLVCTLLTARWLTVSPLMAA